jgi:hypothetical protein
MMYLSRYPGVSLLVGCRQVSRSGISRYRGDPAREIIMIYPAHLKKYPSCFKRRYHPNTQEQEGYDAAYSDNAGD